MRSKSLIGALVAAFMLIGAVSAYAIGTVGNTEVDFKPSVSSKDAGTKQKPKNVRYTIDVTGTTKDGTGQPATSTRLLIGLPSGFQLNSKKWPRSARCSLDASNRAKSDDVCPRSSRAGTGRADVDGADGAISRTLNIKVYVLTNGNLGFFLRSKAGEVPQVTQMLQGTVSGRKINVAIPQNVQEPVQGVPTGIRKLRATITAKARINGKSRGLVETTSCPRNKRWTSTLTDTFRGGKLSKSAVIRCTK